MGKLTRLIPHYTQPHGAAQVDWSNPLTKGLRDLSLLGGSQRYNAASKTFLSSNGTANSDPRGPVITTDATAYSVPGGYAVLPITVIVGFVRVGPPTSGNHALWISLDGATGLNGLYLRYEDTGTISLLKSQVAPISSGAFTAKPEGNLIGMAIDAGTYAIYGDGNLVASGTHAVSFNSDTPVIGSESGNAAEDHPNGIFYFHAVWDRVLSADEIKRVSANPWQIFQPRKRELYVVAASGISAALTGQAASVALGNVSPVVTAAISGQPVPLSLGTMVPAFERAITGQGLTVSVGSVVAAVAPALSGQSMTVEQGNLVAANEDTTDTHDGWLQPVKRRKQSKEVRRELERLFKKAEVVVEKIAPKPTPKTVHKSVRVVETGPPPIHELQMVLMHMQLIQDHMTGQQMQRMAGLQAQIQRTYNIRARAALLAA